MMRFLKRRASWDGPNAPVEPTFGHVRAFYGTAFHLESEGDVLCGYDRGIPTGHRVTATTALATEGHPGFHYCTDCLAVLRDGEGE